MVESPGVSTGPGAARPATDQPAPDGRRARWTEHRLGFRRWDHFWFVV